jgi:hypothetical protein
MQTISYTRLYADAAGESHFERVEAELAPEGDSPEFQAMALGPAAQCRVVGATPAWKGSEPHTSPRRQVFCTLRGEYEIGASDGNSQRFPPGRLLLLEDTTGKGHTTRLTGGGDLVVLIVTLAE